MGRIYIVENPQNNDISKESPLRHLFDHGLPYTRTSRECTDFMPNEPLHVDVEGRDKDEYPASLCKAITDASCGVSTTPGWGRLQVKTDSIDKDSSMLDTLCFIE